MKGWESKECAAATKDLAKVRAARQKAETEPDWEGECANCGASPIVPKTGKCGPCTFGEAETVGGNW